MDVDTGDLLPTGGMTIAYTLIGDKDMGFQVSLCSEKDLFCYATGREVAAARMMFDGPIDVIDATKHPRAQTLVDWIANNYFNGQIAIVKCPRTGTLPNGAMRYRWLSTFHLVNYE